MKAKVRDKKANIVRKARADIERVLRRYQLTMLEVMGVSPSERDIDEQIWKEIEPTARRIRKKLFQETYPALYAKLKKKAA